MAVRELFEKNLKIVNIGLDTFYKDLKSQNVECVQVNWKPKAGGDVKMTSLLDRLKKVNKS